MLHGAKGSGKKVVGIEDDKVVYQELLNGLPAPEGDPQDQVESVWQWANYVATSDDIYGKETELMKILTKNKGNYESCKHNSFVRFFMTLKVLLIVAFLL